MKTRICVLVCMLAIVLVLAGFGQVQATTLYSNDFESYNGGGSVLAYQDGWANLNTWMDLGVGAFPAAGLNTTKSVYNNSAGGPSGEVRSVAGLSFSPGQAFTASFWVYNPLNGGETDFSIVSGQAGGSNWLPTFGVNNGHAYIRDDVSGSYGEHSGSTAFANGNWYELQMSVNLATAGGLGTFSSRNLTAGQTAFTQDATLVNVPLGLTMTGGQYTFSGIAFRSQYTSGDPILIDNLAITTVPEPSTIVLLTTGLFGLLAYAWRKRK